ncbi:hypothetical protein RRG08_028358 [Elysia crispata]|uniref:Uncharacterized protein n=1 Tax=Elysia crispata TaxID=231223 RepID=A0AAE1AW99_9GAST|nr:hypothetical protein RRG08_028358 [Elysia crispata]
MLQEVYQNIWSGDLRGPPAGVTMGPLLQARDHIPADVRYQSQSSPRENLAIQTGHSWVENNYLGKIALLACRQSVNSLGFKRSVTLQSARKQTDVRVAGIHGSQLPLMRNNPTVICRESNLCSRSSGEITSSCQRALNRRGKGRAPTRSGYLPATVEDNRLSSP